LLVAGFFHTMNIAASYSIVHSSFSPRMRATAVALIMLASAVLGMSFGPPTLGFLSDFFAAAAFEGNYAGACAGRTADIACRVAAGLGIQQALVWVSPVFLWAGFHYILVDRHLQKIRND
jgi:MFS family permease